MRIRVIEDFKKDLKDLVRLGLIYFKVPITFSPVIEGSGAYAHVHSIFGVAFGYVAVATGLPLILVHQVLIKLRGMVRRAYLIMIWQHFMILKYYSAHGFLSESCLGAILAWFMTGSIFFGVEAWVVGYALHHSITSG